jgi:predicted AAA+ superfamily ATPase
VPGALAPPIERPLVGGVTAALRRDDLRRFQLILGPRRVGKTTVMYQAVRHLLQAGVHSGLVWWLRLDHPLLMDFDLGQLARSMLGTMESLRTVLRQPLYVFFDELVYAKNWDLWLKTFFDEQWPMRIVASSSAVAALRRQHTETGVGRWDERFLTPYLLSEYLGLRGTPVDAPSAGHLSGTLEAVLDERPDLQPLAAAQRELLFTGGFPELLVRWREGTSETERLIESQRVLRADAVERAVYKDIPQSFGVDNPMLLERLLYVAAGQAAGIVSPTKLSQQLGISEPTVEKYLSYLERSFVLFLLPNYSGSEVARQRRGRRLYFYDTAVRNAVLERGLAPIRNPAELGLLFENMAAAHLFCLSRITRARCAHWRDGNFEVDLIYDDPEEPLAFEIATSAGHTRRGLSTFVERHPRFRGRAWVVSLEPIVVRPAEARDGIGQLPLEYLLLAIGSEFNARVSALLGQPQQVLMDLTPG